MKIANLSSVCEIIMGQAPEGTSYNSEGIGLPLVAGASDYGDTYPNPKKFTTEPTKLCETGDIILCIRATIGDLNLADKPYCLGRGVAALRPKVDLDSRYLWHSILNFKSDLERHATGSTFKQVSSKNIAELEIPLPPLPIQRHIARVLDQADQLRKQAQQMETELNQLAQAVFLEMFGDPVTNPKGWKVAPLYLGIDTIQSGWSAVGESRPAQNDEYGVLKISSVTTGVFIPSENKAVDKTTIPEKRELLKPKKGDLLFSRANTRELVAATALVQQDYENLFLSDKLWRINFNLSKLTPEFFHYLLQHPKMHDRVTSQATGTSGSMLNISQSKLENTPAPYPPISLQQEFSKKIQLINSLRQENEIQITKVDTLFQSLIQKAFKGELIPTTMEHAA